MFDACFRKAQSPMGALAPCAPPVCDYSNQCLCFSALIYHVIVCVCVCVCVFIYAKGSFIAVLRPVYRRSTTYMYLMHTHSCT
jgi:hypothetical protein